MQRSLQSAGRRPQKLFNSDATAPFSATDALEDEIERIEEILEALIGARQRKEVSA